MHLRFALSVVVAGNALTMCLCAASATCSAESNSSGCVMPAKFTLRGPSGQVFGEFTGNFLRENTEEAFDISSHQRIHISALDVEVLKAELLPDDPDALARFRITFSDGHEGTFRLPLPAHLRWSPEHELSARPRQFWGVPYGANDTAKPASAILKQLGVGGPSRFSFDSLCGPESSPEARAQWAEAMHVQGITLIDGMPFKEDANIAFANCTAGYVYPSVYGYKFTIKSVDRPNNLAFTNLMVQMHTDVPYMSTPPGIQLFHCLVPAAQGGESMFLDGFHAAQALYAQDPEAFKLLAEQRLRHFDLTREWHLSALHKTLLIDDDDGNGGIDGNATGQSPRLRRVVFNERTRDSWRHWAPNQNEMFSHVSRALRAYERIVDQEARYVTIGLQAGEMAAIDNFRVMHARKKYRGGRHYQGAFMDWDPLYAHWRAAAASFDASEEHHRHF